MGFLNGYRARNPIIIGVVAFVLLYIVFGSHPYDEYTNIKNINNIPLTWDTISGEASTIATASPTATPKPTKVWNPDGYTVAPEPPSTFFKLQPEWDFDVPAKLKTKPKGPDPSTIAVLTAADGMGHNGAIPDLLKRAWENRQEYCDYHGYRNVWMNTSRYDIGEAHRTWSKMPAIPEVFHKYPEIDWIWLVDSDAIIMSPETSLTEKVLKPAALNHWLMKGVTFVNGSDEKARIRVTQVKTLDDYNVEDIDLIVTQDHQSMNTGSMLIRRSMFTKFLLDIWTDPLMMSNPWPGAEQDAIKHLTLEHLMVRQHVGIVPQRVLNAYVEGGDEMRFFEGDLIVHMAGCWVTESCAERYQKFWDQRKRCGKTPTSRIRRLLAK